MNEFEAIGIFLVEVNAGNATVEHLPPKLAKVCPAFVINPRAWEETAVKTGFEDANGKVNILAEAHLGEAAEPLIDVAADAHVKGTGIELVEFLLSATDAAGGEETRHGIGYGLLCRSKRVGSTVGTAECLTGLTLQLVVNGLEITGRNHYIGIENDDILASRTLYAIVAALSGSAVRLAEIVKIEFSHIACTDIMARHLRTVLDNDNFKSA